MTRLLLFVALLVSAESLLSQTINKTSAELTKEYNEHTTDTNKVRLLLQLDSLYLYQMDDEDNIWDSALLMSRQAQALSTALHFQTGYNDATFLMANDYAERRNIASALSVANAATGELKVRILIMIGERYLFRAGELRHNIDSSYPYIIEAETLADSLHDIAFIYECLCLKGKYYFALGNIKSGRECFQKIIADTRKRKDILSEAHWWAELGRYMPHTDSTYNEVTTNLANALVLYKQTNSKYEEVEVLENLAYLYELKPATYTLAEDNFKEAITLRRLIDAKKLYSDYCHLSEINILKGNYNISLLYALKAVQNMLLINKEDYSGGIVYSQLAIAYKAVGDINNSLVYFRMALAHLVEYRTEYLFPIGSEIVHALLLKDSTREALLFLLNFKNINPPIRFIDREIVAASFGDCYAALQKYDKAESSYKEMIDLDSAAQAHMGKQTVGERFNVITGSESYYTIGRFYVDQSKWETAKTYLRKAISFQNLALSLARKRDVNFLLFKIDSAQGNYTSAITYLQIQQQLQDSIFNEKKSRQIAELQIQYATEKKEKDFELLSSQEKIKDKELKSTLQNRNFTYILIAALIILIAVIYNRFIQKQKANRRLEHQQKEIDFKNFELQKLVNEKDNLLEEKEWLMKEIHHRVKNNLQIVISLLSTQSKYVDNKEAFEAINESTHRMQAMSLIHQKLYQSENTASVNMPAYISELAKYLETSFDTGKKIRFETEIDVIELELSQAIPIGLILNELITNAIKYAFEQTGTGTICVCMHILKDNAVILEVKDNGKGMSLDCDFDGSVTMGMRLIKGLVKQINGTLKMENKNGVCAQILFVKDIKTTIEAINDNI